MMHSKINFCPMRGGIPIHMIEIDEFLVPYYKEGASLLIAFDRNG